MTHKKKSNKPKKSMILSNENLFGGNGKTKLIKSINLFGGASKTKKA
jgi:hypothetical protein